jgi:agmatine deiminase
MRAIIQLILILILSSSFLYSQELPNYLTDKEKEILKTYVHPIPLDGSTNPPSFVPRTMAEWEELQGIMITWRSYIEILRQVVDYAQEEGIVYIVCSDSNSVKSNLTSNSIPLYNLKF